MICVNRSGWINEMQEMEKCSLNPGLVFLLLERRKEKKKGKGKRDPGQMHLGRVPGRSRERQKFAERQKDH